MNANETVTLRPERMLTFFLYDNARVAHQALARYYYQIAEEICMSVKSSPERTIALRCLLDSRTAALRAVEYPGV